MSQIIHINAKAKDGLFEDVRNYINLLMLQIQMGKSEEALKSLSKFNSDMSEWERRLKNGESWEVWPESMKKASNVVR